jgi:hypothetical protein
MVAHSDNVESGSENDAAANRNVETDFAKSRHESSHKFVDVVWFDWYLRRPIDFVGPCGLVGSITRHVVFEIVSHGAD